MQREALTPYLLILPATLFLLFLFLTPLVEVVLLSFQGARVGPPGLPADG